MVAERVPHAFELHELLASDHDTTGFPESFEVIAKLWPASMVTEEEDRLTIPPPGYPPAPHPAIRTMNAVRSVNKAVFPA